MIRSTRTTQHASNQTSDVALKKMEIQKLKDLICRLSRDNKNNDSNESSCDLGGDGDKSSPITVLDLRDLYIADDGFRQSLPSPVSSDGSTTTDQRSTDLFRDLLTALSGNTTVKSVNIVLRCFRKLKDEELIELFRTIGSMKQLEALWVGSSGLAGLALRCISEALECCPRLKSLTLHSIHFRQTVHYHPADSTTNVNDPEFIELCRVLSTLTDLQSLTLSDVEETFHLDSIVQSIRSLESLQELHLKSFQFSTDARLSEESLAILSSSPTIRSLNLERLQLSKSLPGFLTSLEHNDVLETLNLDSNQMGQEGGAALAYLIRFNGTLRKLRVGNNMLGDEAGRSIACACSSNNTLKALNLQCNLLGESTAEAFADVLAANLSGLETLDLSLNVFGNSGGIKFATALMSNHGLKELTLARTTIGHETCAVLAAALKSNCSLERLNIGENRLGTAGWLHLVDAVSTNKTLKSLNLRRTKIIDNKATSALINALRENTSLENVNLSNDVVFTKECCQQVEDMLSKNMTLVHLWLPSTNESMLGIHRYIKLNRVGRRQLLLEPTSVALWTRAISELKEDEVALFSLLQSDPSILEFFETKDVIAS